MILKNWIGYKSPLLAICMILSFAGLAQVSGNGKVVKEERNLSGFHEIAVKNAIKLVITQGNTEKVVVETDENIQPYLVTEVVNGSLNIGMKGNINQVNTLNVYVTAKELSSLESSSAAKIISEGSIKAKDMTISSSSGSAVKLEINCQQLKVKTSSGSSISLAGSTQSIDTESSSGASLNAAEVKAERGEMEASSGASVQVQVTKESKARASSGAHITVKGNPAIRDSDSSSGGSVSYR